ncbi:YbfB/YjiJ family MFS transporter, partial [Klebsiella pneumoniae]
MNNQSRQALWLALAGSIVLMIGMGYGRFAFTGVLPLMLNEGLLTLHEGNLAASANYAGYLVGALLLARVQPGAATRLSIISAGLTIASLALLAWVSSPWTIITLRAVAGALSAITLIAGLRGPLVQIVGPVWAVSALQPPVRPTLISACTVDAR